MRLGPFDVERRWRPAELASLPEIADRHADRVVESMDECLAVLCGADDVLVTRRRLPDSFLEVLAGAGIVFSPRVAPAPLSTTSSIATEVGRLGIGCLGVDRLEPYAWLPETVDLAGTLGTQPPPPPDSVVQMVNSKTWSNQVAADLGLPGVGVVVRSPDELRQAVAAHDGSPTLVKDPFGVAGRGCIEITSPGPLRAVVRTVTQQAPAGRRVELLVQRLLPAAASFSAHVDIGPNGTATWHGIAVTQGEGFSYRGSRPAGQDLLTRLEATGYRTAVQAVAARLASAGYHGPVCIDSLLLDEGTVVPLLEINARLSMGRLCLELDRQLQPSGLNAQIAQTDVAVPPEGAGGRLDGSVPATHSKHRHGAFAALVEALRRAGVLHRQGRPGILPLTANTLLAPGGRLIYAIAARTEAETSRLEHTLDACLTEANLPRRGATARVAR